MQRVTRAALLVATAATAVATVGGCAGGGFLDQAEQAGITVQQRDTARDVVDRVCNNMRQGAVTPVAVLAGAPNFPLSSNDQHLIKLGVAEKCPEHDVAYARVLDIIAGVYATAEDMEMQQRNDPDYNVGPDGYCTATPCGSAGRTPEGQGEGVSMEGQDEGSLGTATVACDGWRGYPQEETLGWPDGEVVVTVTNYIAGPHEFRYLVALRDDTGNVVWTVEQSELIPGGSTRQIDIPEGRFGYGDHEYATCTVELTP